MGLDKMVLDEPGNKWQSRFCFTVGSKNNM